MTMMTLTDSGTVMFSDVDVADTFTASVGATVGISGVNSAAGLDNTVLF